MGHDARGTGLSDFNGTTSTSVKWKYSTEAVWSAPVIGPDGTIYFASGHELYAMGD